VFISDEGTPALSLSFCTTSVLLDVRTEDTAGQDQFGAF